MSAEATMQTAATTAAPAAPQFELPTYQHYGVMEALRQALRPLVRPGQMLLWRDAFRWKNDAGVLSNHYECMDLDSLCADFGYEMVHDFCHAAIVKLPLR